MEIVRREERKVLTLLWKIENIGLWKTGDVWNAGFLSPEFIARTLEGKCLKLFVWPKFIKNFGEHVCFKIKLLDDSLSFPIDCEWSYNCNNGSPLASGSKQNQVMAGNTDLKICECPINESTSTSAFLPYDTLTIQIRIWSTERDLSNNEFIYFRSRFEPTDYSFLWHVPGFSSLPFNHEATTPVRFGDALGSANFLLKLSFTSDYFVDTVATVKLTAVSIPTSLIVILRVSVLDNEQKVMKEMEISTAKHFIQYSEDTWISPKLFYTIELLREKSKCIVNDVLTLRCEISAIRYVRFVEKYNYGVSDMELDSVKESCSFSCYTQDVCPHREDPLRYLVNDLLCLYKEQRLTDFELRVGDTSFPVHKNILSARSPVFNAMFNSDMKESVSNFQDVPDVDIHTLNRMLIFLYGGAVEKKLQFEGVAKLYYAADKYQIESLKQQCFFILQSNMSVSNISKILKLADKHQDQQLISSVEKFILRNYDEVMQSEEWETFLETYSYLAGKAMHKIYKKRLQTKHQ